MAKSSTKPKEQVVMAKTIVARSVGTKGNLRWWNLGLFVLSGVQGLLILILSKSVSLGVNTNYITRDVLSSKINNSDVLSSSTHHLFDVNITYIIVVILFLSALFHLLAATIYRSRYDKSLDVGVNRLRWVEYAVCGGATLIVLSLLSGVYDIATLLMIFGFSVIAGIFWLNIETQGKTKALSSINTVLLILVTVIPWVIIAIYLFSASSYGLGAMPAFVYWLYFSLLLVFLGFAANIFLQRKQKGLWLDYLYGERIYMLIVVAMNSLLAWQVFAGLLRS